MEKRLRRKFILMSMLSLLVVLLLLFCSINAGNYIVITNAQDKTLEMIASGELMQPPKEAQGTPFNKPQSPESMEMIRFFSVTKDKEGKITSAGLDFISSVGEEQAAQYAEAVANKSSFGYYGEYRYAIYQEQDRTTTFFLNCANQLTQMRTLLALSLFLSAICFAAMLVLVTLFSGRAVAPYVRNMEIQKRFITDASHELRTPLTSIATSIDVIDMDNGGNEWIENIKTQTQRLSKLVSNLVMLSRLDEELPLPDKAEFSLSEAIWESAAPFITAAKATKKQFETHIDEGLLLYADVASIQQMLSLLLDNALKYSGEGGSIRLDAYKKKQKIFIEVANTCEEPAISDPNRLFDRFYRGEDAHSGRVPGNGVGLSVARAIAAANGGEIKAEYINGNSIKFTVML